MYVLSFLLSAASYLSLITLAALSATALLAKERREPLAPVIDVVAYIVAVLWLIFGLRLIPFLRLVPHHASALFGLFFFLLRVAIAQLLWWPAIRRNSCATLAISLLLLISATVSWIVVFFRMHH